MSHDQSSSVFTPLTKTRKFKIAPTVITERKLINQITNSFLDC